MDLLRSSPKSFHYAVEGFFDLEERRELTMWKVARAAYQGKDADFIKFWPLPTKYQRVPKNPFRSKEEFRTFYDNLKQKYKFN